VGDTGEAFHADRFCLRMSCPIELREGVTIIYPWEYNPKMGQPPPAPGGEAERGADRVCWLLRRSLRCGDAAGCGKLTDYRSG
jgi:hypothetical protein